MAGNQCKEKLCNLIIEMQSIGVDVIIIEMQSIGVDVIIIEMQSIGVDVIIVAPIFHFLTRCQGRTGMSGDGGTTLEYTPAWVVAAVCIVIVAISLGLERLLHYTGKAVQHFLTPSFIHFTLLFFCYHFEIFRVEKMRVMDI